jgi:hypothetical protein
MIVYYDSENGKLDIYVPEEMWDTLEKISKSSRSQSIWKPSSILHTNNIS